MAAVLETEGILGDLVQCYFNSPNYEVFLHNTWTVTVAGTHPTFPNAKYWWIFEMLDCLCSLAKKILVGTHARISIWGKNIDIFLNRTNQCSNSKFMWVNRGKTIETKQNIIA